MYSTIKRIIDTIIASVMIIVLSPIFLIVAIAVKLDSKGPAIFKQERIGKDFKPFKMYKFRSMVVNAQNMGTGVYAFAGDPRITKVGRIIRKTSLDELPQLWNIIKGDMAFVGPRAPVVGHFPLVN
jgi:undecaprenyl phosphate N,N'-diacetylbacillosamine 1-phosphate transferase